MKLVTKVFLGGLCKHASLAADEKQAVDQYINEAWNLPGKVFYHVSSKKWNKIHVFQEPISVQVLWNLCSSVVLKE